MGTIIHFIGVGVTTTRGVVEVALLCEFDDLAVGGVVSGCDNQLARVAYICPVVQHTELDALWTYTLAGQGIAEMMVVVFELHLCFPSSLGVDLHGYGVTVLLEIHHLAAGNVCGIVV